MAHPPRIQGRRTNPDLCDAGREQARRTGEFLKKFPLSAVYSSPLARAHQTADLIAAPHQRSVELVDELTEVDVGEWESMSWEEIAQRNPLEHQRFLDNPAAFPYLGGESLSQVLERVLPALLKLCDRHLDNDAVAIAGHNVVNRVVLAQLLGVPLRLARGIHQDNCGINVLRYREGQLKLMMVNSALHLL